jgi:nucleotide-binding universal stress UspA family protein
MTAPLARPADDEEHYGPAARRLAFERGTDGPRTIMVGVDGSDTSLHAAASAFGTVVFVAAPSALTGLGYGCAEQEQAFAEVVQQLRDEARTAAQTYGVPVTLVTRRGDPFAELTATADGIKADFVFVGASAQAGHRFVGSIATRLVKLGRWPVVVVP